MRLMSETQLRTELTCLCPGTPAHQQPEARVDEADPFCCVGLSSSAFRPRTGRCLAARRRSPTTARWAPAEGPFVSHRQTSHRAVNSENLSLALKNKQTTKRTKPTPFLSVMPGGTVFARDDSVLLEVSVYTDYKH